MVLYFKSNGIFRKWVAKKRGKNKNEYTKQKKQRVYISQPNRKKKREKWRERDILRTNNRLNTISCLSLMRGNENSWVGRNKEPGRIYELPIQRNAMTKQIIHTYIRGEKNKQRKKKKEKRKIKIQNSYESLSFLVCVLTRVLFNNSRIFHCSMDILNKIKGNGTKLNWFAVNGPAKCWSHFSL